MVCTTASLIVENAFFKLTRADWPRSSRRPSEPNVRAHLFPCRQDLMKPASPYTPAPSVTIKHPEWSKNATIYQINTRQFTAEGTFRAAEEQLPRLKNLGVVILWLMPVNEIGEKGRKGSLGSPYAVKDYYKVNPEFGTLDDLKHFVTVQAIPADLKVVVVFQRKLARNRSSQPGVESGTRR